MQTNNNFSFEISLSVLNHLGRNLYRSFVTVIGEAISNSWDADAHNVWIYIDKTKNRFIIKDDGDGMDANDFQNKFLKIGYSKRKEGKSKSALGRPFIGRKGIGKLALLSCAKKITVLSKKAKGKDYIGGVIDNSALDRAITDDLTPQQYKLGHPNKTQLLKYTKGHQKGTIICFNEINGGIKNNLEVLKKVIALYFRFTIIDRSFNIYVDGEKITYIHLKDIAQKTEFVWNINNLNDPYISVHLKNLKERKNITLNGKVKGFIGSVEKPRDLNIMTADERVGVDLFVNGRLREKGLLRHIPTARLTESYLYGQIHLDDLDDKIDRFTSDREGIVADDPKYQAFLSRFRDTILKIINEWDEFRLKHKKPGDVENERLTRKERSSRDLFNVVSSEYTTQVSNGSKGKVDSWVNGLAQDAQFNFGSYAECFVSENLIRKYIEDKNYPLSKEAKDEIKKWKDKEVETKEKGNISIAIRKSNSDLSYLSMDHLANLVDKKDKITAASLSRDSTEYKPIRDALAHTALLTDVAKNKLTTVYQNIKERVNKLLK